MKHKKRKKIVFTGRAVPCFMFTPATISLTQRALALFDQPLELANHADTKVVFAEQTMQSIRSKLDAMKQPAGRICLTSFDYNERIIIRESVLMYSIELLTAPPGKKRSKELQQCHQIAKHFAIKTTLN